MSAAVAQVSAPPSPHASSKAALLPPRQPMIPRLGERAAPPRMLSASPSSPSADGSARAGGPSPGSAAHASPLRLTHAARAVASSSPICQEPIPRRGGRATPRDRARARAVASSPPIRLAIPRRGERATPPCARHPLQQTACAPAHAQTPQSVHRHHSCALHPRSRFLLLLARTPQGAT
eukprot:3454824-Pleurochrysis_carterae.AAC.5